jgi:hypothetical protein
VVSFPQFSPPKPCIHLFRPSYVLHSHPISVFSLVSRIIFCYGCLSLSSSFVLLSTPLLPRPSYSQIFSSVPYFQKSSTYVPPSM